MHLWKNELEFMEDEMRKEGGDNGNIMEGVNLFKAYHTHV
jgi:hypothetical protein